MSRLHREATASPRVKHSRAVPARLPAAVHYVESTVRHSERSELSESGVPRHVFQAGLHPCRPSRHQESTPSPRRERVAVHQPHAGSVPAEGAPPRSVREETVAPPTNWWQGGRALSAPACIPHRQDRPPAPGGRERRWLRPLSPTRRSCVGLLQGDPVWGWSWAPAPRGESRLRFPRSGPLTGPRRVRPPARPALLLARPVAV